MALDLLKSLFWAVAGVIGVLAAIVAFVALLLFLNVVLFHIPLSTR